MPRAIRLSTIPLTISIEEKMLGAPEQFTFTPTTSEASKRDAQASRWFFAPVSEHIPRDSISRTAGSSTLRVAVLTDLSECTRTALPANGPGIPGFGDGAKRLTTRDLGISLVVAAQALAAVASCRKS